MRTLLPPVMGSLLEHRVRRRDRACVYVSGDTLPGDHLDEIARRTRTSTPPWCTSAARACCPHGHDGRREVVDFLRRVRPATRGPRALRRLRGDGVGLDDARAAARAAGFADRLEVVPRGGTVALARQSTP